MVRKHVVEIDLQRVARLARQWWDASDPIAEPFEQRFQSLPHLATSMAKSIIVGVAALEAARRVRQNPWHVARILGMTVRASSRSIVSPSAAPRPAIVSRWATVAGRARTRA